MDVEILKAGKKEIKKVKDIFEERILRIILKMYEITEGKFDIKIKLILREPKNHSLNIEFYRKELLKKVLIFNYEMKVSSGEIKIPSKGEDSLFLGYILNNEPISYSGYVSEINKYLKDRQIDVKEYIQLKN